MKRLSVFVITIALIVGLVGCTPVPTQYNLTISSTEGGEVTEPGEETFTYDGGEVVDLVAKPDEGYRFVNWTGEVDTIANVNAATTTITMNGDYSITANFVAVYDLTISSTEGGSVTTPGEGVFTHCAGTVVGLAVRTDVGYHFLNWTGDVDTIADVNGSSTTITINDHYSITANFEEEKAVTFADPSLEAAIREAIYIPERPLYPSDLKGLTSLHAYHKNISDLTGLEYCTSLTALDLRWNQISDISPLANLTSLTFINFWENQISNISPLANLTNLTELYLLHNQISDISPLASLTNLTGLRLESNQISDISLLANLTNLTWLYLESNQISDISPLANLTELTELGLSGHQISDISLLVDLTRLTSLVLYDSQISDISPLADLTNLTQLYFDGNQISDISPLANLTDLEELGLGHNQISDIWPLANLTNLWRLYLDGNQISDISPLVENEGLSEGDDVDLRWNPLNWDSINIYIPQLEARGVTVYYD